MEIFELYLENPDKPVDQRPHTNEPPMAFNGITKVHLNMKKDSNTHKVPYLQRGDPVLRFYH